MSAADGMFSAPNATSWAWAAFSRASNARAIAPLTERVLEQVLGEPPEGVLALSGEALAQAVAAGFLVHAPNATLSGSPRRGIAGAPSRSSSLSNPRLEG